MEIIASTTTLTSKETKTCSTTKSAKKIKLIPSPNNKNNYKNKNYISLKKNDLNNRNNRLYFNSNNSIKNDELQKCSSYLKNLKSNLQVEINDAKKNKKKQVQDAVFDVVVKARKIHIVLKKVTLI